MSFSIEGSILLYTGLLSVSVFFSWLHCRMSRVEFAFLAILIPAVLSGIRGEYVGTDFQHYLGYSFALEDVDFVFPWEDDLWGNVGGYKMEYGFSLLLWILTHIFSNKTIVFGIIYAGFLTFSYCGCLLIDRHRRLQIGNFPHPKAGESYAWVGYAVILFSWLIFAFNGLRQYFAISVLLCCIPLFIEKKYFKSGILFLVAYSFHNSVVFALPWVFFCGRRETEVSRCIALFFGYVGLVIVFPWLARIMGYGGYIEGPSGSVVYGAILILPVFVFVLWLDRDRYFYFLSKGLVLLAYTAVIACMFFYMSRLYAYSEIFVAILAILLSKISIPRRFIVWIWLLLYVVLYRFLYVGVLRCEPFYVELLK